MTKRKRCPCRSAVIQWELSVHWGKFSPEHRTKGGGDPKIRIMFLKMQVFELHTSPLLKNDHSSVLLSLPAGINWSRLAECEPSLTPRDAAV